MPQERNSESKNASNAMKGRWSLIAAVAVMLAILGGVGYGAWRYFRKPDAAPVPVVSTPQSGPELTLTGNVAPRDAVAIPSPLEGVLEVLEVPVGGEVLMGQIIGRMANQRQIEDNNSAEKQMEAAQERVLAIEAQVTTARLEAARSSSEATATEGELTRAKAAADRQELLYKEGATARNTYETAKKQAASLQAEYGILKESARAAEERAKTLSADLDAAKKAIENHTKELKDSADNLRTGEVLSPIDGVFVSSKVQPGDDVPAGTADLFTVAPNALKLAVTLEPNPVDEGKLRDGLTAQVTMPELPDTPLPGRVVKTADGKWQVQFETPELLWKPNDQASVRIRLQ